jgi:hypothetical protein
VSELEKKITALHQVDARTTEERAGGEPAHLPWAQIAKLKQTLTQLREDLGVERRLLKDLEKR